MDTGLQGKTALVPASSSGIGLAIARSLAAEGANVVLAGRRGDLVRAEAEQVTMAVHQLLVQHLRLTSPVLPGMRERGWGRVVAVGSSGVQQPFAALALSNMGRAGLADYHNTLAGEVAADGVTVNMVLPGRIDTDRVGMLDQAAAERSARTADAVRAQSESSIPAGRCGRPEEFAAVVTFLASSAASYVTGEQVRCDGSLVRAY